jgi:hypothetical protein
MCPAMFFKFGEMLFDGAEQRGLDYVLFYRFFPDTLHFL